MDDGGWEAELYVGNLWEGGEPSSFSAGYQGALVGTPL